VKEEEAVVYKTHHVQQHEQQERLPESSEYIAHKGDEPLFSRSSSTTDSSLQVSKPASISASRRWCCCIGIAILIVGTFTAAGIYFGYSYLKANRPQLERVYRGQMRVLTDEPFVPDPGSIFHMQKTKELSRRIHSLLASSAIADSYKFTEVFLLDTDSEGLLVHFNLHFASDKQSRLFPREIQAVMKTRLMESLPGVLPDSLEIHERRESSGVRRFPAPGGVRRSGDVQQVPEPVIRQCVPVESSYCSNLPYNLTTFPNMLGHQHIADVDLITPRIKDVVDSGCHPLAYELLCQLVQPVCYSERMVKPCQQFCMEFLSSCKAHLPVGLLGSLQCASLPTEADGPGACISKPGCVEDMRGRGLEQRVCDGTVDCPDFSDELYCDYCPEKHFHCGVGRQCIDKEKMCDGVSDCYNGADEKGCLSLAPRLSVGSYIHQYNSEGYLLYQRAGRAGKVCAGLEAEGENQEAYVKTLANQTCKALEYEHLAWAAVGRDEELVEDIQYVGLEGLSVGVDFQPVECDDRLVVRMECEGLQCGKRPAALQGKEQFSENLVSSEDLDTARHGDWPWHVALIKEGVHVCDGTLIDSQWVMSTKSCFQGQSRAKWTAQMASVRLDSRAPWEQERRVMGMVAAPVEQHSIVILKLERPVTFSDFTRPICLPTLSSWLAEVGPSTNETSMCASLTWDMAAGQLQMVALKRAPLSNCRDKTEASAQTICTEEKDECEGEMVAGAGLYCRSSADSSWELAGVSAWRKGCGGVGERPRLYEQVSVTTDWAMTVIREDKERDQKKQTPRRRAG